MARYPLNLPVQLKQDAEVLAGTQGVSLNQFILWAVSEKVGNLKRSLDDPNFPSVTYRRGESGRPIPVLRDTGIRIQTLVIAHKHWEMDPSEIAAEYPVRPAQVKEALAFFESHREEIEADIAAEERKEPRIG